MKKKGNISIKAKLLGIIIPVVIAIILILVFTAYHVSSGIIESYSKNLLESSVNSQASKIEAWLEENLASMQMAKTMIEKLHPDETQLQTILDASCGYSENYPDGLFLADANGSFLKGTDSKKAGAESEREYVVSGRNDKSQYGSRFCTPESGRNECCQCIRTFE